MDLPGRIPGESPRETLATVRELEADSADLAAVLALLHRAFAYMEKRIDPPSSLNRLTLADIRAQAEAGGVVGAFVQDGLAGCAFLKQEGAALYVGKLAVDPNRRELGIGRRLMAEAEARAKRLGLPALTVQTRVELTENRAIFEKLGFVKSGESAHPGYDRPTSITMTKFL